MMALFTKLLLLFMIHNIHGDPERNQHIEINGMSGDGLINQIIQKGRSNGCDSYDPECDNNRYSDNNNNNNNNYNNNNSPGSCKLSGKWYADGTRFNRNCMPFFCKNKEWYSSMIYNGECAECKMNNDPHFTTFDGKTFDYHGHSVHVISQGCEVCPNIPIPFVHSLFIDCAKGLPWATCVKTVYFKPEKNTYIRIVKDDRLKNSKIIIDDHNNNKNQAVYNEDYAKLTVLEGDSGEHPAFAWIKNDCIHIMGFKPEGYLVKICKWGASVFAYPSMKNNLCGLCGDWDGKENNDLKFRNGKYMKRHAITGNIWQDKMVDPDYGQDWEINDCEVTSYSREDMDNQRTPAHVGRVDPCKVPDREMNNIKSDCKALVDDDDLEYFVDECVFDQSVAYCSNDKTLQREWLQNTNNNIMEAKQQKMDTINLDCQESTVECNNNGRCYMFFNCRSTWTQARDYCNYFGWTLAAPYEQFDWFHDKMPSGVEVWLNVKPDKNDRKVWFWMDFFGRPIKETTREQWEDDQVPRAPPNCASLYQDDGLMNFECSDLVYFACETDESIKGPRNDVGEVDFPPIIGPGRNHTKEKNI